MDTMDTQRTNKKNRHSDEWSVPKRFEKTRSCMMNHASKGDWGMPQQAARDSEVAIQVHCLRLLSGIIQRTTQLVNPAPYDATIVYHTQNQKEVLEINWIE